MELNKRVRGNYGEDEAVQYLEKKGYSILDRNYHYSRYGEIDIIAKDIQKNTVVFVEVKSGNPKKFGNLIEKITPHKMRQIYKVAEAYIHFKRLQNVYFRFDVILVEYDSQGNHIRHIENAFS